MILNLSIESYLGKYQEFTPEQWIALREKVPQLPTEKPSYGCNVVGDTDTMRAIMDAGLEVRVTSYREDCALVKLQNVLSSFGERVNSLEEAIAKRAVVQISIPDVGLMLIDEVDVLEDCCTDHLRGHLNDGWRILAVCPPNAQRRPDYVIGRRSEK